MNIYRVYADYGEDTPKSSITFSAISLPDAYFNASSKIIEKYEDLSDESCKILSNADVTTWIDSCNKVFDLDNLNISDIEELNEEDT